MFWYNRNRVVRAYFSFVVSVVANYNNYTAWRATGVWETLDLVESKGGPFRSYVFYDQEKDFTYHVNYLIFYPDHSTQEVSYL